MRRTARRAAACLLSFWLIAAMAIGPVAPLGISAYAEPPSPELCGGGQQVFPQDPDAAIREAREDEEAAQEPSPDFCEESPGGQPLVPMET